jgi:ninein-like protein
VTLLTRSHVNYEDISSNLSSPNSPVKGKVKEEVKSDLIDSKNDQLNYSNNSETECDNLSLTNLSTEEYLRNIWDKLRVGRDGYLNMEELYAVCEHIGMDVGKDIIEQLFDKLDNDGDGKVSFDELLQGLFKQQQESQQIDLTSERHPRQFIEDDNYGTPGNYFQSLDPLGLG